MASSPIFSIGRRWLRSNRMSVRPRSATTHFPRSPKHPDPQGWRAPTPRISSKLGGRLEKGDAKTLSRRPRAGPWRPKRRLAARES